MRAIACVGVLLLLSGCSEYVRFRSFPSNVEVFVDDGLVGRTPCSYATRDVVSRTYRVELPCGPVTGHLTPRVAPGRVIGAIFTLGILAATRPMKYYVEDPVDLTCQTAAPARLGRAKLYNLKTGSVGEGTCNDRGECTVHFPDGLVCGSDSVRETQGTTTVTAGSGSAFGIAGGQAFGAAHSGVATGREVANTQAGVAVFQCGAFLVDCALHIDAASSSGHGDCESTDGTKYRLMLLPN